MAHDYKNFPELTNRQMETEQFNSPHPQITEDFYALVVKVTDGDTIRVSTPSRDFDFPIRFLDVDAPEMNEGGAEARNWLKSRIEGEEVEVKIDINNRVDKWGRLLGRVFHRGMIIGEEMGYLGLVLPYGARNEGEVPHIGRQLLKWSQIGLRNITL